eukprot:123916-Hanusia_phi.AAC.2
MPTTLMPIAAFPSRSTTLKGQCKTAFSSCVLLSQAAPVARHAHNEILRECPPDEPLRMVHSAMDVLA